MINENSRKLANLNARGSKSVAKSDLVANSHFFFTKKTIERAPLPTNGQPRYYHDTHPRAGGLVISVSPVGRRTFWLYRKIAGRPERIKIGPFPDLTIEQARAKAAELNGAVARGENPGDQRRKIQAESTLGELHAVYIEQHSKLHKKTWQDDESMFRKHLNRWRVKKLSAIRKSDVVSLHGHIGRTSGHYAANRTVELLSSMFSKAIEWGWQGENPASGVKAFREQKRERFMNADELGRFFDALAQELNLTIRDYILLSLLTGARRGNVQSMRWAEIDWQRAMWTIPGEKFKTGEQSVLPSYRRQFVSSRTAKRMQLERNGYSQAAASLDTSRSQKSAGPGFSSRRTLPICGCMT